jgi:outer membrane lipoprotein SlyB
LSKEVLFYYGIVYFPEIDFLGRLRTVFSKLLLLSGIALFFSGCANQSGWTPMVDPHGDPNVANIARDKIHCRVLAKQAAGNPVNEVGKGALTGGATGAATGAALGAVTGAPAAGAALGAATGGVSGMIGTGISVDEQYKQAFINCMRGRGHNVI